MTDQTIYYCSGVFTLSGFTPAIEDDTKVVVYRTKEEAERDVAQTASDILATVLRGERALSDAIDLIGDLGTIEAVVGEEDGALYAYDDGNVVSVDYGFTTDDGPLKLPPSEDHEADGYICGPGCYTIDDYPEREEESSRVGWVQWRWAGDDDDTVTFYAKTPGGMTAREALMEQAVRTDRVPDDFNDDSEPPFYIIAEGEVALRTELPTLSPELF